MEEQEKMGVFSGERGALLWGAVSVLTPAFNVHFFTNEYKFGIRVNEYQ